MSKSINSTLKSLTITPVVSALMSLILLSACSSSSDQQQSSSLSYAAVGQPLGVDYTVHNLFVGPGSVYLTLDDDLDETFGYAQIASSADASVAYAFSYLTLPSGHPYMIIGDMVIDDQTKKLYIPVAYQEGANYQYTWLQYEPGATTPNALIVGSYAVPAGAANQFALQSATFFNGSIYANYNGTIVGFNVSTGQVALRKENFLVSSQDAFWIQDKNTVIAIASDANRIVRKDPETNLESQIGETFSALEDQGYEVSPHFTVYGGYVSLLAIKRDQAGFSHLALCRVAYQAESASWSCNASQERISDGSQIINLDTDAATGSIYFVLHSLTQGTQLYRIN